MPTSLAPRLLGGCLNVGAVSQCRIQQGKPPSAQLQSEGTESDRAKGGRRSVTISVVRFADDPHTQLAGSKSAPAKTSTLRPSP